jgi:type I restriction enzyme M protein
MFEQTFKNIDDILHKDAGCNSELNFVEQTSWILFLKCLDDLERDRATAAELTGKSYTTIVDTDCRWTNWAAPKITNGGGALKIDHNALTADDLTGVVNNKLFPYLKKFKLSAQSADTIEYTIGEIFSELKNRVQSGYNLREVIIPRLSENAKHLSLISTDPSVLEAVNPESRIPNRFALGTIVVLLSGL